MPAQIAGLARLPDDKPERQRHETGCSTEAARRHPTHVHSVHVGRHDAVERVVVMAGVPAEVLSLHTQASLSCSEPKHAEMFATAPWQVWADMAFEGRPCPPKGASGQEPNPRPAIVV